MSADPFVGPAVSVHTGPDDRDVMRTLLIRLARKAAFHDALKTKTDLQAKVGDLVVETSSFRPIPDPHSIGWLRQFDTDDTDGRIFWIEPLFAPSGAPWVSWGNAMFLTIHPKLWQGLGLESVVVPHDEKGSADA